MGNVSIPAFICCVIVLFNNAVNGVPRYKTVSRAENYMALLAMDGDPATCSVTGFDRHPWWQMETDPMTVTSIHIKGAAGTRNKPSSRIRVRVGDVERPDIEGDGLPQSAVDLCAEHLGPLEDFDRTFTCKNPRTGRFIIIEAEADLHVQLKLCDVIINP